MSARDKLKDMRGMLAALMVLCGIAVLFNWWQLSSGRGYEMDWLQAQIWLTALVLLGLMRRVLRLVVEALDGKSSKWSAK